MNKMKVKKGPYWFLLLYQEIATYQEIYLNRWMNFCYRETNLSIKLKAYSIISFIAFVLEEKIIIKTILSTEIILSIKRVKPRFKKN